MIRDRGSILERRGVLSDGNNTLPGLVASSVGILNPRVPVHPVPSSIGAASLGLKGTERGESTL